MSSSAGLRIVAFAAATAATAVLASVFSTQFVIAGLSGIGVEIPLTTRLVMTITDLAILLVLVPAAAACFLPAFALAGYASHRLGGDRQMWFTLAGAAGLCVELIIIEAVLGLMPVGGARTVPGLAMQTVAGAVGGFVFARLTAAPAAGEPG